MYSVKVLLILVLKTLFLSFTQYPAYRGVDRGNLVLNLCVPHFPLNFHDMCLLWILTLRFVLLLKRIKKINQLSKSETN